MHAPVGDQRPLAEAVNPYDLLGSLGGGNLPFFLTIFDNSGDEPEIVTVSVQKISLVIPEKLG